MSFHEQEALLFFKLYLLSRSQSYVDYMAKAKTLSNWFEFNNNWIVPDEETIVICGSCFNPVARNIGGGILHTCHKCNGLSNMAYELQRLAEVTKLPFHTCMYLLCKAVEDIYKYADVTVTRNFAH